MKSFSMLNNPDVYQITERINQLCQFYSKAEVRACLYLVLTGEDSVQLELERHILNLYNTYHDETMTEALLLVNLGITQLDFNIDDDLAV